MTSSVVLDERNWRFEYKYRLPVDQYLRVRNCIAPYMEIDDYTARAPEMKYLVRSVYYDSIFLNAFNEKVDGDSDRIKFRIRSYADTLAKADTVRAEMKVRKGAITEKHGSFINKEQYLSFIETKHWPEVSDVVLEEFERYVHLKTLQPVILTEYRREGYRSRAREELRITFDHQVRSTHSNSLFPEAPLFHDHHHGLIVLEIKCIKQQPDWLRKLVHQNGFKNYGEQQIRSGDDGELPDACDSAWSV